MTELDINIKNLPQILEKWQNQKGVSRNQALKLAQVAVDLLKQNQALENEYNALESLVNSLKAKDEPPQLVASCDYCTAPQKTRSGHTITLRWEYVSNGYKPKKEDTPPKVYGPYLYAYFRVNGRLKSKYIGKVEPSTEDIKDIIN